MKLALCLFKYFPYGGLQRDFLRIAKECLRRGHQVDVFTQSWEGDPLPGVMLHLIPTKGIQNHARNSNFAKKVAKITQHYDLVMGFNKMPGLDVYYAADTCYQAKARTQRFPWYRLTPRYHQLVAAEAAVFSKGSSTEVFLIAPAQQAEFSRYYETPPQRFHILPPGIAKDRMAPANAEILRQQKRNELKINDDERLLLFIGSGFKTKGLDRALRAVAALPIEQLQKTHFYIVGKDNPRSFQHLAKQLHITANVHFLGGRDDIAELLLAGDALLHPAYNENTGTVLLEALAAGLPVLTTDACGYAHYILEANAGIVITSPFQQSLLNNALSDILWNKNHYPWRDNALVFSKTANIYDMPHYAVDLLESFKGAMF